MLLVLVPAAAYLYLLARISRYRKDRGRLRYHIGNPFDGMTDVLTRANYSEQGLRLYPWLVASLVVLVAASIIALGLIARG